MTPYKAFSVETPFGANYYAIIVETDENGTAVYTNRSGRWEPDTQFMPLDLSRFWSGTYARFRLSGPASCRVARWCRRPALST